MQASLKQANICRRTWNALLILAYCSIEAESILGSKISRASNVSNVERTASRGLRLASHSHGRRANESRTLASSLRARFDDPDIKKEIQALEIELAKKIESTDKLHKDLKTIHHKVVAELRALDVEIDKLHLEFVEKAKAVRGELFRNTVTRAAGAKMFAVELDERDARMKDVMRNIGVTHGDTLLVEEEMVAVASQAMSESMFVHGFVTMMADEMVAKLGKLEAAATGTRPNVGQVDEELQATMDELHKTINNYASEEVLLQEEFAHFKNMEDKDISAKKALITELQEAIAKLDKEYGGDVSAQQNSADSSNQKKETAQQANINELPAQEISKNASATDAAAKVKRTQNSDNKQILQERSKQAKKTSQSKHSSQSPQKNVNAAGSDELKAQDQSKQGSNSVGQNAQNGANTTGGAAQKVQEAQKSDTQVRKQESAGNVMRGGSARSIPSGTPNQGSGEKPATAEDVVVGRVWVRHEDQLHQFGEATEP